MANRMVISLFAEECRRERHIHEGRCRASARAMQTLQPLWCPGADEFQLAAAFLARGRRSGTRRPSRYILVLVMLTAALDMTLCMHLVYRLVIGVAEGSSAEDMVFYGMLGIIDPPRPGVQEAVLMLRRSGIAVKMITGDAEETAVAIGECMCE